MPNFSKDDWSYNLATKGKGLTLEALHIVEMLAYLLKPESEKAQAKIKEALEKLMA